MKTRSQITEKKRIVRSRGAVITVCLALLLTATVGTTAAFMYVKSETDTLTLEPSGADCAVISDNGDYSIKNTGDTEAYVRAAVVITWQDEDGNIYGKKQPALDSDYSYMLNLDGWFDGGDGYYYYADAVECGARTEDLISNLEYSDVNAPEGYFLTVEILAGAVQSYPEKAAESSWGVTVNRDGSIGK